MIAVIALWNKKRRFLTLVIALLMGSSVMSLRQQSLENSVIQNYYGQSVQIRAQVVSDPNITKGKSYSFIARALSVDKGGHKFKLRIPIRILTWNKKVIDLLPGQIISGYARIVVSKEARVAALVLFNGEVKVETKPSRWASTLGSIRLGLRNISGAGDAGALIPGMVLGDTSKQSAIFKVEMRRSGLTHLVAVSGANFAIVSSFVLWAMQFLIPRIRWRLCATAVFLICFICLVRPSPSVLRAAAMAAVMLVAQGSKRGGDSLPALGFAIAAVVIGDPWQARDAGFALSVLATAGLLLFAPRLIAKLSLKMPTFIAGALAPPISAMLFCSPILVALSGYLSPMSIIANLLAAPVVAPITILGFIAALLASFLPIVSNFLIFLIRFPASFIASVAHWAAGFPVITMRTGRIGFLVVAGLILTWWLFHKYRKVIFLFLLILILGIAWLGRWPAGDWQVANCDIGQGDSMVLNLGQNRAIVIDVGPDEVLEDRCLRALGIKEVPLLILSHFHADHVDGLAGLLKNRRIGTTWISNNNDPVMQSRQVKALLRGKEIVVARRGMKTSLGAISIKVLWPDINIGNFQTLPGEGSIVNDSSVVTIFSSPDFTLMAPGDLESPVQQLLVGDIGPIDIYKVSHHGSANQWPDFMAVLKPKVALISVGAGNTYGHPAPTTLSALLALGARVYRTDLDGAIAITAQAHQFSVSTSKSGFNFFRLG